MEEKVALVTGCSAGGIGYHLCERLAARGLIVYATARSLDSLEDLQHPRIKKMALDVTSDEQVQLVARTIIEQEGKIDVLINNAGTFAPGPIVDITIERVKEVYETNVFSIVRMVKAVMPHMATRREGVIVNIGSVVGEFPTPWTGIYDSSKGAVRIMSEVLEMECRPFNIDVMLVTPVTVRSRLMDRQEDVRLPPDSLYGGYLHNIIQRLDAGRGADVMPTDSFAEEVVSKALSRSPPKHLLVGGKSGLFRFFGILPRRWFLSLIWSMFSKPKVQK